MDYYEANPLLRALDAHNVAKENSSVFEDVTTAIGNIPNFLQVSAASGLNSLYNTGVAFTNIFMPEDSQIAEVNTQEWLSDYDDDLGKYYEKNKQAADLVGFIASSLIPGGVAVKGLNSAQKMMQAAEATGKFGRNFTAATKLLAPAMETHVQREGARLAAESAKFSLANANAVKAIATGTQQLVLESLAFETAVAATMFKSPVLEDMTGWDLFKNVLVGGVGFGAALGAPLAVGRTYFGIRGLVQNADARARDVVNATQLAGATRASDKIVQAAEDRLTLAAEPTTDFIRSQKRAQGETGLSISPEVIEAERLKLISLRDANVQRLNNEIRAETLTLSGGPRLGNQVADVTAKLDATGFFRTFFNVTEMRTIGEITEYEKNLRQLKRGGLTKQEAVAQIPDRTVVHLRLHSGKIGDTIEGSPGLPRLADKYKFLDQTNKIAEDSQLTRLLAQGRKQDPVDFRTVKNAEEIEARWVGFRANSVPFNKNYQFGSHDLPALDKAVRDGLDQITIKNGPTLQSKEEIKNYLVTAKQEVIAAQINAKRGSDFLERVSDVRKDWIEGAGIKDGDITKSMFAHNSYARELTEFLGREVSPTELDRMPTFAKTVLDTQKAASDGIETFTGAALIGYRDKLATEAMGRVFASYANTLSDTFPEFTEAHLRQVSRVGAGSSFAGNAGGAYGSTEQLASYIGQLTSELETLKTTVVKEAITPVAAQLAMNPQSAVKFSAINEIVSNQPEKFVLDSAGENLIPRKMKDYLAKLEEGEEVSPPTLHPGTPETIPLDTPELRDAVSLHIQLNGKRTEKYNELNAALGNTNDKYTDTFYPWKPDPRDYKHVAFVKDESLVGVGHTRMLFANDAASLEAQIRKVREVAPEYKIYTEQQAKDFYAARGDYEYDKTIHENYVDTDLLSRGVMSNVLPATDPVKIVNKWLQSHTKAEITQVRAMVLGKYEKQVSSLRRLGDQLADIGTSSRRNEAVLVSEKANPYISYIKTMLNVPKGDEYAWWKNANEIIDSGFSKAVKQVTDIWQNPKYADPQKLEMINKAFDEVGFKSAYYDGALNALANSSIPKGMLNDFVRSANAFLTTTVLRLDPFNTLNNLLGNTVLMSTELNYLMKEIEKTAAGAGELRNIAKLSVPGTGGDTIMSPSKLIANSLARLHGPQKDALVAEYKRRGFAPNYLDQYYKGLDATALRGTEDFGDLARRKRTMLETMKALSDTGEKLTGNRWAEQFNRLVAADVAKQIVDIGVKSGVIDERVGWSYVSTFVNRTQGVVRAAERPLMFQGPIGQAMGLFQSYQFNLMQQSLRYIGEGKGKSLAMLAGMQSSVYGASSLPGFNLINSSLVGTASGNDGHGDLYTGSALVFGKEGAEWLMYGVPSNVLNASLYTRGDTNPRTWSVVPNPTNPGDIPFISSFAKSFGAVKEAVNRSSDGAPVWQSMLAGIEHLGFSRPLAGIAATARALGPDGQVTTTTKTGGLVFNNDLVSWSTAVRIAGAKPLDEAVMVGNYFRQQSYAQADSEKRKALGKSLRTALVNGQVPDQEMVDNFAERYAAAGGKQSGFNRFYANAYKDVTMSQAEQLAEALNSPTSRNMQLLMGGRDSLEDLE